MANALRMTQDQYAEHLAKKFPAVKAWAQPAPPPQPIKRSKYGAVAEYVDRIRFASKAEAARYRELRLLERAHEIRDLVVHPAFPLTVDGRDIGVYRADFRYLQLTPHGWTEIVEDVKSVITAQKETFRRTAKHIQAQYGIAISLVLRDRNK